MLESQSRALKTRITA